MAATMDSQPAARAAGGEMMDDPGIGYCEIHDCQMEWVTYSEPCFGLAGYWYCEECWLDEEADFDAEHSDFEERKV